MLGSVTDAPTSMLSKYRLLCDGDLNEAVVEFCTFV